MPMRLWGIAFVLLAAACQQQARQPVRPVETMFDGAEVTNAAAQRAHGERLTHVLGCTGCHGAGLTGRNFTADHPEYGPLYASNLTLVLPHYSDAQIEALLRTGVHPERKTVWGMPSEIFQHLSAADMTALVAHLRTLRPAGRLTPPPQFSAQDKKEIAAGLYKPAVQGVRETRTELPTDTGPQYALGRYISEVTCAECHGPKLEGRPGDTPNLVVAGSYSRAEFERLITQGIPTGNRKLKPLMADVARTRFSKLMPHERDALYAYLKARAEQPR
jgi:cytochrome c553